MRDNLKHHEGSQAAYLPTFGPLIFFLMYMSIPLLAFSVIYIAPIDVLSQWEWAQALCETVWQIFPIVKREAVYSTFPQVRQFGICLAAALMPAQVFLHLFAFAAIGKNFYLNMKMHKKMGWAKSWLISIFGLILFGSVFIHEPQAPLSKAGRLMETQRFSSAFVDSMLLLAIPVCLALLAFSTVGIFQKFNNLEGKS